MQSRQRLFAMFGHGFQRVADQGRERADGYAGHPARAGHRGGEDALSFAGAPRRSELLALRVTDLTEVPDDARS